MDLPFLNMIIHFWSFIRLKIRPFPTLSLSNHCPCLRALKSDRSNVRCSGKIPVLSESGIPYCKAASIHDVYIQPSYKLPWWPWDLFGKLISQRTRPRMWHHRPSKCPWHFDSTSSLSEVPCLCNRFWPLLHLPSKTESSSESTGTAKKLLQP